MKIPVTHPIFQVSISFINTEKIELGVASVFILLITSSLNTALTWHFLPIVLSLCLSKSIEQNKKNIVVGVVYRPPDRNLNDFNNELDHLVSIISKENKTVFLLGDWNMNLMNIYITKPRAIS